MKSRYDGSKGNARSYWETLGIDYSLRFDSVFNGSLHK